MKAPARARTRAARPPGWLAGLAFLLAASGCVRETPGHEQPVALWVRGETSARVAYGTLTIAALELQTCDDDARSSRLQELPRLLGELLLPTARAHSESGPLRIGVPHVIALHGEPKRTLPLGRFFAPRGRYCHLAVELGPADADTTGFDGGVGYTMRALLGDDHRELWSDELRTVRLGLTPALVIEGAPSESPLGLVLDLARLHDDALASSYHALSALASGIALR